MSVDTRQNQSSFYFFLIFFKSLCHKNPDLLLYTGSSCYLSIIRLLIVRRSAAELSFLFPLIWISNAVTWHTIWREKGPMKSVIKPPLSRLPASPRRLTQQRCFCLAVQSCYGHWPSLLSWVSALSPSTCRLLTLWPHCSCRSSRNKQQGSGVFMGVFSFLRSNARQSCLSPFASKSWPLWIYSITVAW